MITETMTKPAIEEKMCVKELAFSLGVSVRYVYEMRRCGFKMDGCANRNQTATIKQAVDWMTENDFKMIHGAGITNGEQTLGSNLKP